jgi:hypothetical protein
MKNLGQLQSKVLSQLEKAAKIREAAHPVWNQIAYEMDQKYEEWKSRLPNGSNFTPPKPAPASSFQHIVANNGFEENLTGRRIYGIEFDGEEIRVGTFKDALLALTDTLQKKHPNTFDAVAPRVSGRHPYFSENAGDLTRPHKLDSSKLWIETCLSINVIVKICQRLVTEFGYPSTLFRFDVAPNRTRARKGTRNLRQESNDLEDSL